MFDLDSALGVEVRGADLRLCLVAKNWQGYTVKHTAEISRFLEMESSELHSQIQNFLRAHSFNRENVLLGIPRDQVVIHYLELPLEVEENLAQVIGFQATKFEPTEEGNSYYDYIVLERNEKEKSLQLQLIMVPRGYVDYLLELFRELGLYPAAIRLGSIGFQQLFKAHKDGFSAQPSIVLNLAADCLEIVVTAGNGSCFAHTVKLEVPLTAEEILSELGLFVPRLRLPSTQFRKIYLCGEMAEELFEPILERFGEVEMLVEGINLKPRPPERFLTAFGLAVSGITSTPLARFNLIPPARRVVGYRASWIPSAALLVLLSIMLLAAATSEFFQQRSVLAAVEEEVAKRGPELDRALAIRQEFEGKLFELQQLEAMMCGRQRALNVLRELTERIPESAYLQSVNIQRAKASLVGFADNASSLIAVLQASDHLGGVESRYITQDRRSGLEKFNFEAAVTGQCSAAEGQD